MQTTAQFETPENVNVTYEIAGLGTRFVAWIEDQLILVIFTILLFVTMAFFAIGSSLADRLSSHFSDERPYYVLGLVLLIQGLASFVYYGLSELFWRGQTIGKKHNNIRVVKVNGFALDPGSIILRNLFRIIDHFAILWFVPYFSKQSQRLGDMVAGTICIVDEPVSLTSLRDTLLARPRTDRQYRFDAAALKRIRPEDFNTIEKVIEGLASLPPEKQQELCGILSQTLARQMQLPEPPPGSYQTFLEDLLTAEYRRQQHQLG